MAGPTSANYVFLPWIRQGAAASIQAPDSLTSAQAGVVSVPVQLRVNDTDDAGQQVRLYGPGDVVGIDPLQVVRTEPRHLATDFEPNYFAAIDFDQPDFPWLFTPAAAGAKNRLRPWLCLVVVRKQEGVALNDDRSLPLPLLEIRAPALPGRELPDLSESWAWAHAQVTGSQRDAGALKQALAGNPALTVSRLVCSRRLDPLTEYLACVVPAFDLGVKAGLGQPITPEDEGALNPAWASGDQAPVKVTLPVYVHWEFRTSVGGDFEALVRLLQARKMPSEAGKRLIDIGQPGFVINPPLPPGTTLELEGALRVTDAPDAVWPDGTQTPLQAALKPILDAPAKAQQDGATDPLLAPPIYGRWHAARGTVNTAPAEQTWLDELNLDPRTRATAAFGTQVIQEQQELLMASAWEQLGEIERVNQLRRQAQLAREVNGVYYTRHFSRFSEATLLNVVAPARSRLVVEAPAAVSNTRTRALLARQIEQSSLPVNAVSAPLRRLTSPRGAVNARFQASGTSPGGIVASLNLHAIIPEERQAGAVTIDQVSDQASASLRPNIRFENITQTLSSGPQLGRFKIAAEDDDLGVLSAVFPQLSGVSPVGMPDSPEAQAFRVAAKEHMDYMVQRAFLSFLTFSLLPIDLPDTKTQVLQHLNPATTITARVQASLQIEGSTEAQADPLEPILDAPSFPQPMYEALRDLSQDTLFPGLENVPPNTVTVLETNPAFIEAFLVGLNTEMGRELLWRNYPTDQRGTYFRQFWDALAEAQPPDIPPITSWGDGKLGHQADSGEQLVLLIRGELLRRYPNAVIYAVAAVPRNGQLDLSARPEDESHPVFRGTLMPDVTFLGFNLTKETAMADPGWFFVIQEQPTEPRFGLDAADFTTPLPLPALTTWNDLSWRYLADTETALEALLYAPAKATLPVLDNAEWGRNAAHQAYITLQRPVRIAIHAKDMIPT
jgi:hypothetical protein